MKLPFPQRGLCILPNMHFLPPVRVDRGGIETPAYQMARELWRDTFFPVHALSLGFIRLNDGLLCRVNAMYA